MTSDAGSGAAHQTTMTIPPPLPPPPVAPLTYQPAPEQFVRDVEHLRYLSIGHYVYGALTMLCSSVFIVHVVIGILTIRNPALFNPPPATAPGAGPGAAPAPAPPRPPPGPPPRLMGWMFAGMGSFAVAAGWTLGICTIIAGRCIARRRARLFTLIIAGVNCMNVPIGAALGVFTFIVLLRDSVRALYDGVAAGAQPIPVARH